MKKARHEAILKLISQKDIETQDELLYELKAMDIDTTQATVSRDIRELKLSKVTMLDGRQKYVAQTTTPQSLQEKYVRIFRDGFISMDMAQNILVIKTVSGMAMAVAAAVDSLQFKEIVGSIAGDDTIMCAVRTVDDTAMIMESLRKLLEE
ncbi:MAG: arginine repressor [Lachnospiraceae bacterium]|nr:arginine repressor [Lachnospiraceae bacterium]